MSNGNFPIESDVGVCVCATEQNVQNASTKISVRDQQVHQSQPMSKSVWVYETFFFIAKSIENCQEKF